MAAPVSQPPAAELSPTARRVLDARYLRRDRAGRVVETPPELFHRAARAVADAELLLGTAGEADRWQDVFRQLLVSLDFLPNSPTLMNAGTPLGQLAACFVVPLKDTMESIFDALRAMALLQRAGGGTGFDFSPLRPSGDLLTSTGGQASGPVSFMRIFDAATEHIKQGGRRRGANMAVLRVDHPDIFQFLEAKASGAALQNFNLSVGVTDAFMRAAADGGLYAAVHPATRRVVERRPAAQTLERIVDAAWRCGDPGLLYLDAVSRDNPTPDLGDLTCTNPCGEVPLLPWESCILGSINLARMVRAGPAGGLDLDWPRLRRTAHLAVRFLDDALEVNRDPLPEIAAATRARRKVGLGVMGFAELLILLGVPYDTDEAVIWADRIMTVVAREAAHASRQLARERGVFPDWERSVWARSGDRRRNATLLSVAPTGTLSMIAGTSGGIEPLYALAYRREHTLGGPPIVEVNPVLRRRLAEWRLDERGVTEAVMATGTLREVPEVPEAARRLFVTATEMAPARHLAIQRAFQRHVDNAVAKTVNLAEDATVADVAAVYTDAWRMGLKGVTVYRSGSKATQVLTLGAGEEPSGRELFVKCDPGACRL